MPFRFQQGNIKDLFVTEEDLIDRFTGQELLLWGRPYDGRLGNNTSTGPRSSPVQTVSGGTNWKQVSVGFSSVGAHTAAIKTDGTLWLWGTATCGTLGDNTATNKSSPVQTVAGGSNWKQVAVNGQNTAAVKTDGTLWIWGTGLFGQLGNNGTTERLSPVQTISGGNNWKQVSIGNLHVGAVKTDGTLWLWGVGTGGQLGNNLSGPGVYRSSPVQTISGGNNWKNIQLGTNFSTAIKTDGTLWSWGCNCYGLLGNNSLTSTSSPVQTISGGNNWKKLSVGSAHVAAIKTDGTLWGWGRNDSFSQLGDNSVINRSSPVQTISGGTNWRQVAAGGYFSSAIKTDGTLWTWGDGAAGMLGNDLSGSTNRRSSPVQTITCGTGWRQVSMNQGHAAALRVIE